MKIRGPFAGEVAAIRRIRKNNPNVGAYTLATGILAGTYTDPNYLASSRPRLSVLSVIRRYDADVNAGKTPALVAA